MSSVLTLVDDYRALRLLRHQNLLSVARPS